MNYSYTQYTGDGGTRTYAFPFSYIDPEYIKVFVDGVEEAFTFLNDSAVELNATPRAGALIEIRRDTKKDVRIVDFQDGSVLTESSLDLSAQQAFDVAQESFDNAARIRQDLISKLATSGSATALAELLASSSGASQIGAVSAGAGAVSRTLQEVLREAVSVKQFGAKGNGVTDDTVAIQAALTFAHNSGGATVRAPAGTYKLTATLSMGANTTLLADAGVVYKRFHNASFLANDLGITTATAGYSGNGNICIDGGIWDGNSVAYYDSFNGFAIGYAQNVILRNYTILDVIRAHAVDLSACKDVLIDNVRFLGYSSTMPVVDDGLGADREYAEAIQIDQNRGTSFGFGAMDSTQNLRVTMRNCYVGKNPAQTDPRFKSWGAGIGSHGGVHNRYNTDIKILGNTFEDCGFAGVRMLKWNDVLIHNNKFLNCVRGVHITPSNAGSVSSTDAAGVQSNQPQCGENMVITSNLFKGQSDIPVFFNAPVFTNTSWAKHRNVVVSGNVFKDNVGNSSVELRWVSNAVVSNNVFENSQRAIGARFVDGLIISGNKMKSITYEMVYIDESSETSFAGTGLSYDYTITGNSGRDVGRTGINLNCAVQGFRITNNFIVNVSTESATRYGITVGTGASFGTIDGNTVRDGGATNKPVYGVYVTPTAVDVVTSNNSVFGATVSTHNLGTGASYVLNERVTGTPEGKLTGRAGSTAIRTDGAAGTCLYVKESGIGNVGWAGK